MLSIILKVFKFNNMYKWKPNTTQRREFAEKMKDPEEKLAYEKRKYAKTHYNTNDQRSFANKSFIAIEFQYERAIDMLGKNITQEERQAANMVLSSYSCQDKIDHKYIHIVNHFNENN